MLGSVIVWLDSHPDSYWVFAGLPSLLVLVQVLAACRQEARGPTTFSRGAAWRDALVLFLFLFAWRWPFLFAANDYNPDESQLIAGAITLGHDPVFWRSVDGATSGPLNFYVLLPWHWLGLPLGYLTARLTGLLLIWGALFACHRALAGAFGRTVAWLGVLPAAGFFATVTYFDLVHYSSEHLTLLLTGVAIWLLAGRKPHERFRLWTACFVAGAAVWAKLQAAPLSAALVGWALWQVWRDDPAATLKTRFRRVAGVVSAALAPTGLAAGLIVATGQAAVAFQRYFAHNLLYVGNARPLGDALQGMYRMAIVDGRLPLLLATALLLLSVTILYCAIRRRRPPALFFLGGLMTLAAIIAVIAPRREYLHYNLLLPVPLTLWLGAALGGWWLGLSSARARWIFACLVFLLTSLPPVITRYRQPLPAMSGQLAYHWRHPRTSTAEIIHALAGKTGSLGVWGWACHLYVETGLPQATRDANSIWSIGENAQRYYHRECYLADLQRNRPAVFVDAVGSGAFAFEDRPTAAHEIFSDLADYIRANYTLVTDLGNARIYARNGLPTVHTLTAEHIATLMSKGRLMDQANTIEPTLTALDQFKRKTIAHRNVLMLLPPAQLEWQLDANVREVSFGFGFDPVAYIDGKSNGAEVILELVDRGQTRVVYRRFLDPDQQADDRYPQTAIVTLPPFAPGTHLVLRTEPGPYGDTAWDWVYLDNLQWRRSPGFLSTQFPGFGRVPDQADADRSIYAQNGSERLLLLPGAATLTYVLDGNEQRLQFEYGIQADEGDAVYQVVWRRRDQSTTVLFERRLQPAREAADRGRQQADVALPEHESDNRLILRITPGAGDDGSSNQTYLTGLRLQ